MAFLKAFMFLYKTTKSFMCLKTVILPVLILPNLAIKASYALIFFSLKAHVLIFEQQRLYVLNCQVLIKNECIKSVIFGHLCDHFVVSYFRNFEINHGNNNRG